MRLKYFAKSPISSFDWISILWLKSPSPSEMFFNKLTVFVIGCKIVFFISKYEKATIIRIASIDELTTMRKPFTW